MKPKTKKHQFVDEKLSFDEEEKKSSPSGGRSHLINVKIKRSDNNLIKLTINTLTEKISDVKLRAFPTEVEEGKLIRLIYQGKIL